MSELADFLLARIAEDEAVARQAVDYWSGDAASQPEYDHITLHDPARVLAECEAKRRIVERYLDVKAYVDRGNYDVDEYAAELSGLETALEFLTAPHADHPDYREEWKP